MSMTIVEKPRLDILIPNAAKEERTAEEENSSYYPRVSNAGSCCRALTYTARGISPKAHSGRMVVLFDDGHIHESATIRWLEKTPYKVTDRQLGLNIAEIPGAPKDTRWCGDCQRHIPKNILHGHIDGLIHTDNHSFLFEHKGLSDYSYQKLSNQSPVGYVQQCCAYLTGMMNIGMEIEDALLLVKNKNNSEYRQIHIHYNHITDSATVVNEWNGRVDYIDNVVSTLIDLHTTVEQHRDPSSNLPDRPFDYESFQCRFCRFRETCWMSLPTEIKDRDTDVMLADNDPLSIAVTRLHEARQLKAEAKNLEDESRAEVNRLLAEKGIKSGQSNGLRFSLSAFNAKSVDDSLIPEDVLQAATRTVVRTAIRISEAE